MKAGKSSHSIKKKLFLSLVIFTLVTILLMVLLQLFFFPFLYRFIRIRELKSTANEIVEKYTQDSFFVDSKDLVDRKNFAATIVDITNKKKMNLSGAEVNGTILYTLSTENCLKIYDYLEEYGDDELVFYQSKAGTLSFNSTKNLYNPSTKNVIVAKAFVSDDVSYMVVVNAYLELFSSFRTTIAITLATVGVFMICMTVILGLYLSKKVVKPIIKINDQAKDLGGPNRTVFDENVGYKEANELSKTLNIASAELSKTESLRTELIANVSHDLRTPLTLIRGYSEVMRDIPGQATPENLQVIIDETDRLSSLVNDMLQTSRIQSENIDIVKTEFSITEEIKSVVNNYSLMTENKGYKLFFDCNADVTVTGDKDLLIRAVMNLINNAITHSGDGNAVLVRQLIKDKYVRIEVSDKGPGISPDKLDLIWDRYYKVDSEHKRPDSGSGLGLSIVKSIVSLHNGNYGVRSREGENSGSTFWFEIEYERISQ